MHSFHAANIHEARFAARVARATPLLLFSLNLAIIVACCLWHRDLLILVAGALTLCVCIWLWRLSAYSFKGIIRDTRSSPLHWTKQRPHGFGKDITHIVVLPNYKEDEELLSQTLRSLSEAQDGQSLRVVLAMEDREGASGLEKANRLKERFERNFAEIMISMHPDDLYQEHNDGTWSPEVPGKASNLKWAVRTVHTSLVLDRSINLETAVITVADADCLFHPMYFAEVTDSFVTLRRNNEHLTSMWQAPQLPFRNYFESPAPSRIWGYISTIFEFGGVSSLSSGGQHMLFSAYSVPLQVAVEADLWDGDVITEDHHAYLKGFFYSVRAQAIARSEQKIKAHGPAPSTTLKTMQMHPIMFPVKSTSVASSEGALHGWRQRWQQAVRHAQGVAELSYAVLATYDLFCALPASAIDSELLLSLAKVLTRLLCVHILPTCQMVAMIALSVQYLWFEERVRQCSLVSLLSVTTAFGTQAADPLSCITLKRVLTFIFALPTAAFLTVALTSYCLLSINFLGHASDERNRAVGKDTVWTSQRGGVKPLLGSKRLSMALLVIVDCMFFAWPLMVVYGFIPTVMAFFRVCFLGNDFEYVTAVKTAPPRSSLSMGGEIPASYGSLRQGVAKGEGRGGGGGGGGGGLSQGGVESQRC